jgi:hypothetical protein
MLGGTRATGHGHAPGGAHLQSRRALRYHRFVPPFATLLKRDRRGAILLIALVAFWMAQAMAIAHASRHVGAAAPGLPGDHSQLCTDCASMLPLLTVAGGLGIALVLARPVVQSPRSAIEIRQFIAPVVPAFRSRAPPR